MKAMMRASMARSRYLLKMKRVIAMTTFPMFKHSYENHSHNCNSSPGSTSLVSRRVSKQNRCPVWRWWPRRAKRILNSVENLLRSREAVRFKQAQLWKECPSTGFLVPSSNLRKFSIPKNGSKEGSEQVELLQRQEDSHWRKFKMRARPRWVLARR